MNGKFLLDTNIVIALFANDKAVIAELQAAAEVFVPSIVIGELYYGAAKSGRVSENTRRIDMFAAQIIVVDCDVHTARIYGHLKGQLHQKGRPIPENDLWIAALAVQHQLTLVSRDRHFDQVDVLRWVSW